MMSTVQHACSIADLLMNNSDHSFWPFLAKTIHTVIYY